MGNFNGKNIAANYFCGKEAVGGKIYFDEEGFTFKSHKLNLQKVEARFLYKDICKIEKRKTLNIIPNGMAVFTQDEVEHLFVINKREEVIEYLQSVCNELN